MVGLRCGSGKKPSMSRFVPAASPYDPRCRDCPRLAAFLDTVRTKHPGYHARPVAPFGDPRARLLIVGLAPGMHGANRTGRPFTGDYAGILLYRTLHQFGFASAAQALAIDDGLLLHECRITNAVKCVPPENKPETSEVRNCNRYLRYELAEMTPQGAILALGTVAHRAVLLALDCKPGAYPFAHGAVHELPGGHALFDSYHCSRYNTQTNRLSAPMFEAVFAAVRRRLQHAEAPLVRSR
jgi:uracil-DNA glycosylase family 4